MSLCFLKVIFFIKKILSNDFVSSLNIKPCGIDPLKFWNYYLTLSIVCGPNEKCAKSQIWPYSPLGLKKSGHIEPAYLKPI